MQHIILLIFILFTFTQSSLAETANSIDNNQYPSLWNSHDPVLQKKLEQVIKAQGLWKQVQNKKLALALVDISDLKHPKLAELNGEHMIYAASLPKIIILLGAFVEIEAGHLKETEKLYEQMNKMIRFSNNQSATYVLEQVGRKRILEIIQDPKFALYDPKHNGGLWVGKAYSKGTAYQRDPLHKLSHGATAIQAARFYYLLQTNQFLSPEYSKKMKEILGKPGITHKFVKGLNSIADIKFYRKSGSWKNYHADSALIEYNEHKYIIIGLSDSASGGKWMAQLAKPLHEIVVGGF